MSGYGYGICPCHACTCSGCVSCDPPESSHDTAADHVAPASTVPSVDPWADEPAEARADLWAEQSSAARGAA